MRFLLLILILATISCPENRTKEENLSLLKWSSDFIMDDGKHVDDFYHDHENFIKPYFSTTYKTDTLIATTLMQVNCCGKSIGDIRIEGDTIYLLTRHVSNVACTCVEFRKCTYAIHNPGNKEFVIESDL